MFPGSSDGKELGRYALLAQVGFEMVVPVGVGVVLDRVLGWTPWAAVAGAALGLFGGVSHLVYLTSRPEPKDDDARRGPEAP
jgi:hypothetical protein